MLIGAPAVPAIELLERAERLLDERSLDAAWHSFMDAEHARADPNRCSAGRWQIAMLRGDFEAAWKESDAIRMRGADTDSFWSGEEIDGKRIIVRCLHGYGDAVQMLRYAPQLAARAAQVTYEASPHLLPLIRCFNGVTDAITWDDPAPEWDVQVEITELPYLFRTTIRELPVAEKYLSIPPEALDHASNSLGPGQLPRVGVVWTCGEWNPARNVPPNTLTALNDVKAEFWNLQLQSPSGECAELRMRDACPFTDGLVPLAATIANLDLIITPDTLAAHLAGALGKPAFVMLQHAADWRWMWERDDSRWYSSLRLFRQPEHGDWSSVVQAVKASLQRLIS